MKKLLILSLLALLSGCVTYYYPETALEDGIYYAEDDPSYVVNSGGYVGFSYYPWSSLDYFYLGYNPYPWYGIGYGYGHYGSRFSVGISYGYSPWYYPSSYYGYYSPWYASHYHYPYYPAWRPYGGYCSHGNRCRHNNNYDYLDDRYDRHAGNDQNDRRNRNDEREDDTDRRDRNNHTGSYSTSPVNRYVSTAPSGYSGNQGMVIRSRESTKIGKSRLEPDKSAPVKVTSVPTPSSSRTTRSEYSTRQVNREVRYRSDTKQSRSRTGPVSSSPSSKGIVIATPPTRTVPATGNDSNNRQSAPVKSTRQGSARPPSQSKSKTVSGSSNRSHSRSSASRSSSARQSSSKQGRSSSRERHK